MRITLLLLTIMALFGLYLWLTLSGALFVLGCLVFLVFSIISAGYRDTAILFFLGSREIKSSDEGDFYAAAIQEAYKLAVPQPKLYFYNGALERAFVIQNQKTVSLILSRELLEICSKEELSSICFELLLQVKKNLASKRTKVMFLIGFLSWFAHGFLELLSKLLPFKEFKQSLNWVVSYVFQPWLTVIFKYTLGINFFRKLEEHVKDYPLEHKLLMEVGSKLRHPDEIYSLSSRKILELSSVTRSRHYQNIITLEFLPHEWDIVFNAKSGQRV